ncbi:PREDICTED: centromere protein U [Miniopterus natalensis]|uniref:centromere protein U n=1 Tax=Miniopterus natalensis TaxID=291302 RepID=UPI0007A6B2FA|nr:PREDICTED: centromere protein U [Miniopterus natalensis]
MATNWGADVSLPRRTEKYNVGHFLNMVQRMKMNEPQPPASARIQLGCAPHVLRPRRPSGRGGTAKTGRSPEAPGKRAEDSAWCVLVRSARIGRSERRGGWREIRGSAGWESGCGGDMASRWRRGLGLLRWRTSGRYSKNTAGRTHAIKDKADQLSKPTDLYDFSAHSDVSSVGRMSENEKDEEPYECFEPPLHSTAIYADEAELSKHCGSSVPSTPQGEEAKRSSNTYEIEESENESVGRSARKRGRKLRPVSDESESCNERDVMKEGKPTEKISSQQQEATLSSELSDESAEPGTPKKTGPLSAKFSVEKETRAAESRLKTQEKKMFRGKKKKSRNEAMDPGVSNLTHIWCLKGKTSSDIMDLDVVLSAFEKTLPEYGQNIESKICKKAINKFHASVKEELIKTLTQVQMLKTLRRKNAKMISDIEKKRQRLVEVQDELLCLEPQLKQLQTKYDELEERRSSLRNAAYFLSNLKQLHQDYSDIREREPNVKETYDASSLPALLFKERTLLGAESHLQNINHQLEKLLDQK